MSWGVRGSLEKDGTLGVGGWQGRKGRQARDEGRRERVGLGRVFHLVKVLWLRSREGREGRRGRERKMFSQEEGSTWGGLGAPGR